MAKKKKKRSAKKAAKGPKRKTEEKAKRKTTKKKAAISSTRKKTAKKRQHKSDRQKALQPTARSPVEREAAELAESGLTAFDAGDLSSARLNLSKLVQLLSSKKK